MDEEQEDEEEVLESALSKELAGGGWERCWDSDSRPVALCGRCWPPLDTPMPVPRVTPKQDEGEVLSVLEDHKATFLAKEEVHMALSISG